jgi:hypothetical protein
MRKWRRNLPERRRMPSCGFYIRFVPWVVITLVCGCPLFGQLGPFSIGVKGGIPISDASGIRPDSGCTVIGCSSFNFSSETKRYTLGPTIELRLPLGFAFEADALYSRLSYDTFRFGSGSFIFGGVEFFDDESNFTSIKLERWTFPILLKWRYGGRHAHPFVDGGISLDHISGIDGRITTISHDSFSPFPEQIQHEKFGSPGPAALSSRNRNGGVLGGGIEFRPIGPVRLTPEARYTRWASSQLVPFPPFPNVTGTNLNEVTFLLGITFGH